MRLRDLSLQNFRSHARTTLPLREALTFVVGPNASGKSSIPDAVAWLLTGRCRGTTASGAGAARLISKAASMMAVAGTIEGPTTTLKVQRVLTGLGDGAKQEIIINGTPTAIGAAQQILVDAIGVPAHRILPAIYSESIFSMDHVEAKKLLLELLNVTVSYRDQRLSLPALDRMYEEAFEQRKQAKRELAAFHIPEAPAEEAPDVSDLKTQLQALRDEYTNVIAKRAERRGERTGATAANADALKRAEQAHDRALAAADATKQRIEQLERERPLTKEDETLVRAQDAVAELERRLADANKAVGDHRIALADANGRLRTIEPLAERIAKHAPKSGCILSADIECLTPAKAFKGELEKLRSEIAGLQTTVEQSGISIKAEQEIREKLIEARRHAEQLDTYVRDRYALLQKHVALQEDAMRAFESVAALQKAAPSLPLEEAAPSEPLQSEINALSDRIKHGEAVISEAETIALRWSVVNERRAQKTALETRCAELELRCQDLGPNGIRLEALRAAISDFELSVNDALQHLGFTLAIQVEPWQLLVNGIPHDLLAESERIRAGLAFALAVADYTGLRFVCIDRVDALLSEPRAKVAEILEAWEGGQAIIAASKEEDFEPEPQQGIGFVKLRAGSAAEVFEPA